MIVDTSPAIVILYSQQCVTLFLGPRIFRFWSRSTWLSEAAAALFDVFLFTEEVITMNNSTWNSLLDELRAYGARRLQRRAERAARQSETAGAPITAEVRESSAASDVQGGSPE